MDHCSLSRNEGEWGDFSCKSVVWIECFFSEVVFCYREFGRRCLFNMSTNQQVRLAGPRDYHSITLLLSSLIRNQDPYNCNP